MSCTGFEDRLNDYAGGYLSGRAKQEVDEHLLICTACRDEVRALKALLEDLSGLPRSIEAPEEIWQATSDEIHARLGSRPVARHGSGATERIRRAGPVWNTWMPLAVAAAAVVVAALALYVAATQPGAGPVVPVAAGSPVVSDVAPAGTPDFAATEAAFSAAADELMASLEARRHQLPPRTLAVIEKNLKAINDAIEETREAMESEPDNQALGGLMRAMYLKKMNLLQGASEIPVS